MDALLELLLLLVMHWRLGLATVVATVSAVALAIAIPPFTGPYGIALVLLGIGAGLLWETNASR